MNADPLSTRFERFRREGDLDALAAVFDRTAPELLRVAAHLVGDPVAAEDLVQETFLAAIERAETFDAARPLLPWLAGILTNRAHLLRRRRARTSAARAPEGELEDGNPREPSAAAQAAELEEELARSLERAPDEYRPVLVLHLHHGLKPAEIAHALGRSPSTVRSQLMRGLEGLRRRLPRGFVASGLVVPSLPRGLAAVRGEVLEAASTALAAGAAASTTTLVLGALAMKKAALAAALLVAALCAWWWRPSPQAAPPGATPAVTEPEVARTTEPAAEVATTPAVVEPEEPAREEVAAQPEPEPEPAGPEPAALEPLEEEVGPEHVVTLRIEDPYGAPVANAEVLLDYLRPRERPNSSYGLGGENWAEARSDFNGVARLAYPPMVSADLETGWLGFLVRHPLFVTERVGSFDVEDREGVVTLSRGAFLVVAGWIGSRDNVITDVQVHVTDEAKLPADAWQPIRDGRPSTAQIPTGRHVLYLRHESDTGELHFSAVAEFELQQDTQEELFLELLPARTLTGRLDDRVPRPIEDGEVEVNLHVGDFGGDSPRLSRPTRAAVRPDGTFEIRGLPPGRGEIIGMCRGWSSRRLELDPGTDSGAYATQGEDGAWSFLGHQSIDTEAGEDLVLLMEPTASFALTVVASDGEPLEGVHVSMWPNVHWRMGYSQIFLERTWYASTNARGEALIENLPDADVGFGLSLSGWEVDEDAFTDEASYLHVPFDSGQRVERTYRMVTVD